LRLDIETVTPGPPAYGIFHIQKSTSRRSHMPPRPR
jgi:hypothetical protein